MLLDTLQRTKQAIIVTHVLDVHFRHASLDIVRRLTTNSRRPRKDTQDSARLEEEAALLELHVVRVSTSPITRKEEEQELARFRQNGIKIIVRFVKPASSLRLSFSLFDAPSTPLSDVLDSILPPGSSLNDRLCFVGYIFRPTSITEDPLFMSFLTMLTAKLYSNSCSSISARPLPLTVYLPPRPTSSDFDLDLPADQVLSLQLLHLASETMQAQSLSPSPDEQKTANKLERRSLQLLSSPPSASKLHRRTLISTPITSSSLKPLILRPAPGPIQSVSMRISLPLSSTSMTLDLSLKVTECLPPIDSSNCEPFVLPTFIDKVELPPTPPPSPPLLRSKLKLSIPLPSSSPSSPLSPISPLFDPSLYTPIEKPKHCRNRIKPRSRQNSIGSTMTTKEGEMDEKWREIRRLLLSRRGKASERSGV